MTCEHQEVYYLLWTSLRHSYVEKRCKDCEAILNKVYIRQCDLQKIYALLLT